MDEQVMMDASTAARNPLPNLSSTHSNADLQLATCWWLVESKLQHELGLRLLQTTKDTL